MRPFGSDTDLFNASRILFELRAKLKETSARASRKRALSLERRVTEYLHEAISLSDCPCRMHEVFCRHGFNAVEREIVLLLTYSALGMFPESVGRVSDAQGIQSAMNMKGAEGLPVLRALSPSSRLALSGVVRIESAEAPIDTQVKVSPEFIDYILRDESVEEHCWQVKSYGELLDRLYEVVRWLRERSEEMEDRQYGYPDEVAKCSREVRNITGVLTRTLERNRRWPLRGVLRSLKTEEERQILLILLGKELGFLADGSELAKGENLARAVSTDVSGMRRNINLLGPNKPLRSKDIVRVSGVAGGELQEGAALASCEFELTDRCLKKLRVERRQRPSEVARTPIVSMDRLVFSEDLKTRLRMALAQVRHAKTLMGKWGLGEIIPYGRAVTVLFTGPPGVGKTAAAEAVASELGKRIIVANYAEIQSKWFGDTEKNVARIFREAVEANAVLFWDEADSMFYDRDTVSHNCEARIINILLQELEKFEGLCILSTNRRLALDSALERRITMKVDFKAPGRDESRRIWEKMIPGSLPVADDVDVEKLADAELTGGEIKNVLLNAARLALCRDPAGEITMSDFNEAIDMEKGGKWTSGRRIGFSRE